MIIARILPQLFEISAATGIHSLEKENNLID